MTNLTAEKVDAPKEKEEKEDYEQLDEEDDDLDFSSDSEIGEALDYLDSMDDAGGGLVDGSFNLLHARRPNAHGGLHSRPNNSSLQPISNKSQKIASHFRASPLEEWEGRFNARMSNSVTTAIRGSVRDMAIGKTKTTEKADRATVEQANVYHATKTDGQEFAIKIYKTSVLVFKDRDRYVQGDYRFRHNYCKHNPRKMVQTWAEKEMRNLMRVRAAGIRCPTPLLLRLHVLVMEFIGKAGWAAPRLKDANLSHDKLRESYVEMIIIMRTLYQKCKLVHGDLSEYNILYFEGFLYIIDVSQSVELDHPHALDFLREDCIHVSDFFKKNGVAVMTIRELFDFIVDPTIDDDSVDNYLEEVQQKILARGDVISAEEEIADSIFVQNVEADVDRIISGKDTNDMYYQTITGLKKVLSMSNPEEEPVKEANADENAKLPDGESESESEESEDDSDEGWSENEKQTPAERKAARKENKKKVKEENREARKSKVPKAVKKKKKKLAKAKKNR
ncbi:serine/threonine-protein kinase rio1 [Phtheirospermum japonicum]|uniref:Serine/threonine-protein kinase RIO1 n=1 Tax=Phtheirospermum japonicum TaxID=374723 RepID=A0A830B6I6_9LAMI|nr:serine/threonine-protein kinase rio1 [Phtheirospermum japonicum]